MLVKVQVFLIAESLKLQIEVFGASYGVCFCNFWVTKCVPSELVKPDHCCNFFLRVLVQSPVFFSLIWLQFVTLFFLTLRPLKKMLEVSHSAVSKKVFSS